jgi:hypothetical protein
MRPEELAAVGRNVNSQGGGVSEESIQTAMDAEIEEERKGAIARQKSKAQAARSKTAQNKADMRNAIIQSVADVTMQAGKAAAATSGSDGSGSVSGPKSARVAARAERAGQRGNLVKQAKLQDRSATLKSKEDLRLAAQKTKLNERAAKRKPKVDARKAAQQRKLDEYKLEQAYGGDTKRKSYSKGGSLYGRKQPSSVSYSFGEQEGGIMSSPGGAGRIDPYAGIFSTEKK